MAKIYWRSIKRGARTFKNIPENIKDAVKILALEDVKNSIITTEEYKEFIGDDCQTEE